MKGSASFAVVFDLDGTLVDSTKDIVSAFNHGLVSVGASPLTTVEVRPLIGTPLVDMYARALPDADDARVRSACDAYRGFYIDHCADETRPFPGVVAALDALAGKTLAVATTKKTYMAVELLSLMGLDDRFAIIQGTDDIPAKPNPAVLHKVASRLRLVPDETWMVGDTLHDVAAAKAAGMRCCAVSYGVTKRAILVESAPDLVVDDLAEFVDHIL